MGENLQPKQDTRDYLITLAIRMTAFGRPSRKRLSPTWVRWVFVAVLASTIGLFVAAAVYGTIAAKQQEDPSADPVFPWLVFSILICLGVTLVLGSIETVLQGRVYSGIARRQVSRRKEPFHFWAMLGLLYAIAAAIIAYGVWRLANLART